MKLVRDEATVDDLLQLTFLKAHLARERFFVQGSDPDGAVQGWYFAIARNVALDHLRSRSRQDRRRIEIDRDDAHIELQDGLGTIEQRVTERELAIEVIDQVREAIAQLPESQREVVYLRFADGLSYKQIAEVTGHSVNHVGVMLHTAVKKVRGLMTETLPAIRNAEVSR